MQLINGSQLSATVRREVLAQFVHRHTLEHKCHLTPFQGDSDASWLASHAFYVTNAGHLSNVHSHCEPAYLADDWTPEKETA